MAAGGLAPPGSLLFDSDNVPVLSLTDGGNLNSKNRDSLKKE